MVSWQLQRAVIVRPIGGLGNQLFMLAAAIRYGRSIGCCVHVNTVLVDNFHDGIGCKGFDLTSVLRYYETTIEISVTSSRVEPWFTRLLGRQLVTNLESQPTSGLRASVLDGYFQEYEIVNGAEIPRRPDFFVPINPGPEYTRLIRNMIHDDAVAVHVRRGDYLRSDIGVLDSDYFVSAIRRLREQSRCNGRVYCFTDAPNEVAEIFRDHCDDWCFVSNRLSAAASLSAMSHASAIVTSNSSFSWWAAWLSGHENVIIPSVWSRQSCDLLGDSGAEKLLVPGYMTHQSSWEDPLPDAVFKIVST